MKRLIFIFAILVAGCQSNYLIMTANPVAPRHPWDVEVYFSNVGFPKCKYSEVANIITKQYGSPHDAVAEIRRLAADAGADFVKVDKGKNFYGVFSSKMSFKAIAYTCDEVDKKTKSTKLF